VLPTVSLKLAELFSGPFLFNVPVYQRPYSWTRENAEQLLDDFLEAAGLGPFSGPESSYFLGTILLMDPTGTRLPVLGPKMSVREFDVVDGQQRLVTLMTMFAVLRDLEPARSTVIKRRVQSMILAQNGSRFFRSERLRLHVATRERAFFEANVLRPGATLQAYANGELTAPEAALLEARDVLRAELEELPEETRRKLFDYVCDKCNVVVIVSNNIDRAHRIFVVLNERGKKLQRNDILKADVLSRLSTSSMQAAVAQWDQASAELGEDFDSLFAHIRTIYGHSRPQIVSGVRAVVDEAGGAEPFFRDVFLPLSAAYKAVRSSGTAGMPQEITRPLQYLNRLPEGDWAPAAMLALKDWRADPQATGRVLSEIDRLACLLRILCAGTGKRVRRFADVVSAMRSGEVMTGDHPAFQVTRDEMRNIGFHLRDLHKRNPKICKLLLLRLSNELDGTFATANPEAYTVEHVLPQRPAGTSEWRRWFPSAEERNVCTESIGNLVLISQKQNDKARNASFADKKVIYQASDDAVPMLSVTRDILIADEWRRFEIEAREERLLGLLERMWRLDLSSARQSGRPQPKVKTPETTPNEE
jgi:hypothetical protein